MNDPVARASTWLGPVEDASIFALAPVSLWLEDLSGLKMLFTQLSLRGTGSIRDHLLEEPGCLTACLMSIRVLKVNRKTLALYEAEDLAHLVANLDRILSHETMTTTIDQMVGLWEGRLDFFSKTVNHTVTGRRLEIQLRGNILPGYEACWSRVLIAVEDVTDLQAARAVIARSEAYARGLFEHSPVSLWVNDFSGVRRLFDELAEPRPRNFRAYLARHPDFVKRCGEAIRVLDVNRQTLALYGINGGINGDIAGTAACWRRHVDLLRINLDVDLPEVLIGLWDGKLFQERETINYTLDGAEIHVHLQFSVLPGHEQDWSLVQVARIDMTARRDAEAHLRYLQSNDALTRLHSRSFYNEQLRRLAAMEGAVTVLVADLNGLKAANDQRGHAEGDEMLRRAGKVLDSVVFPPWLAARTGGDEFVILMPGADEHAGARLMALIQARLQEAGHGWTGLPLSLSLGAATRRPGEPLEAVVNRADARMYEAKRLHYTQIQADRRPAATLARPAICPGCGGAAG